MSINRLKEILIRFLRKHSDSARPILLGLSGGPDSLAMLYSLLECQREFPFKIGAAHVDHSWREESSIEAAELEKLAASLQIPFHHIKLNPNQLKGNLEAASRQERIRFFAELSRRFDYQAILLAHHRDDQAETVLKKVFEGGALTALGGLKETNTIDDDLIIWRPWLDVSKAEILEAIDEWKLNPFNDRTNLDTRFLRGRFRSLLFPELARIFGKEIHSSLCRLGKDAQELNNYLTAQTQQYSSLLIRSIAGTCLDLNTHFPLFSIELKFLIKRLCEEEGVSLSYDLLETAATLLTSNAANRHIAVADKKMFIDRRRFFILKAPFSPLPPAQRLDFGEFSYGSWNVTVKPTQSDKVSHCTGWACAWQGKLSISLPAGEYHIGPPNTQARYQQLTSIDRWWTNHKVPAFLRYKIPVIWHTDGVFHEFLSGIQPSASFNPMINIEIERKKEL